MDEKTLPVFTQNIGRSYGARPPCCPSLASWWRCVPGDAAGRAARLTFLPPPTVRGLLSSKSTEAVKLPPIHVFPSHIVVFPILRARYSPRTSCPPPLSMRLFSALSIVSLAGPVVSQQIWDIVRRVCAIHWQPHSACCHSGKRHGIDKSYLPVSLTVCL